MENKMKLKIKNHIQIPQTENKMKMKIKQGNGVSIMQKDNSNKELKDMVFFE